MTTTSETRPLPFDMNTLRQHYYPLEPETAVSQAATAVRRIDQVITAVREEITRRSEQDHQLVSDVIAAAISGDKLEPIAARMVPGDRPILDHRLAQLQTARDLAAHRKTKAEYHDPAYRQWKQACEQVTEEWRQCIDYHERDSDLDRLQRLTDFVTAH